MRLASIKITIVCPGSHFLARCRITSLPPSLACADVRRDSRRISSHCPSSNRRNDARFTRGAARPGSTVLSAAFEPRDEPAHHPGPRRAGRYRYTSRFIAALDEVLARRQHPAAPGGARRQARQRTRRNDMRDGVLRIPFSSSYAFLAAASASARSALHPRCFPEFHRRSAFFISVPQFYRRSAVHQHSVVPRAVPHCGIRPGSSSRVG